MYLIANGFLHLSVILITKPCSAIAVLSAASGRLTGFWPFFSRVPNRSLAQWISFEVASARVSITAPSSIRSSDWFKSKIPSTNTILTRSILLNIGVSSLENNAAVSVGITVNLFGLVYFQYSSRLDGAPKRLYVTNAADLMSFAQEDAKGWLK